MPHTNIDINSLRLYDRDGRRIDLITETGEDGSAYLRGRIYFQPLSVALYDNQNFYMLKREELSTPYVGGNISSSTDVINRNFIYSVAFPNDLKVGQVIRELSSTSIPTPHMAYDVSASGIGWSPVVVSELDPEHSRVKMSQPAIAAGSVDFEALGEYYVFPGENLGDKFVFRWVKKDKNYAMQGWPYLNDEAHYVSEYRIYRNRLYKCVTAYVGPYTGNETMWKEVSVNTDEYGFFTYDVLVDQQNYPFIEKVVEKSVTYSMDHCEFRYPLEFNVAFNPVDEVAYDNILEVWYVYSDDGSEVKIMELDFYGEGVVEDERLSAWLGNFGIKFNKYDAMMLKDYDLKEAMPDWVKINDAMKQVFFNKEQIFPYIGSYRGLANLISILGFKDILHVKEYWLNKNPQSVYFNRMLLVDINDMLDDGKIQQASVLEFNRTVKFDEAMRKTGFLALAYEFTRDSGEVDSDGIPIIEETSYMTPAEVFYKLYRMRDKLKMEFLPTNVVIKDIIGEFIYFQRVTPKYWFDQTKVYNNEIGEDAYITLFPESTLHIQNIQPLYSQQYKSGAVLPVYNFSDGGSDPYESGQRYKPHGMAGLLDSIRTYYAEIARHDAYSIEDTYYWEFGDDADTSIGCPVILELNVNKLTIGDMSGKRLQDFIIGAESASQSLFNAVEHGRQLSPSQNQSSDITVNSSVIYGHVYTHNVMIGSVVEWPDLIDEDHLIADRRTYLTKTYECVVSYTGPYVGFEHNWRAVDEQFFGDIHTYTYTAGITVAVTADNLPTSIEIDDGEEITSYGFPGAYALSKADIAAYIVGLINSSDRPIAALDLGSGVFRLLSSVTDPFTAANCVNCSISGDTADDVAAGIVSAILAEGSPPAINAWVGAPGTGTYYIRAVSYDDKYVNMFESTSSYYTLENIDYLNMYEIEWQITRNGGDQPYSFSWRGMLKDLRVIPHILPYAGEYDVSVRVYDFFGGAVMTNEPRLIKVIEKTPEIIAFTKYEDKFNYKMSEMGDVLLQDCGNSEMYDPCIVMRNSAVSYGDLRVGLLDWDFYRKSMYTYDIATDSGVLMWDTSLAVPGFVPWIYCNHPRKDCWGVNQKFGLTSVDFGDARIGDLFFWKIENTVFGADFLAGFHMMDPAPFDKVIFGRSTGSPSVPKIKYVCPQYVHVRLATTTNVDITNVNSIDGVSLSAGDIVLVKSQSDEIENGVYVANPAGSYFTLTRYSSCDTAYKTANSFVIVLEGSANALTCWRAMNYSTELWDTFTTTPIDYYQCEYSQHYVQGITFDYIAALSDTICAEQHPIMGLFSSHVILYGGSPEMRILHLVSRGFDKYSYQYLSYEKNYNTALWPSIPPEIITGSEYTFYEPTWAYSIQLIQSLEAEYPAFKREELFLYAPIMDILNGLTNDIDYFMFNGYMSTDGYTQVGHLPTVIDENYLALTRTKCFPEGHFIPKYSLVFFSINNLFAKMQYEWVLTNDVTNEEIARITGVPFFVWKFNHNSTYRLHVNVQDKNGNKYERVATDYIHVSSGLQYRTENELYNSRRKNEIINAGMMYGVVETPVPPAPLYPKSYIDTGVDFWYVEVDPSPIYDLEFVVS